MKHITLFFLLALLVLACQTEKAPPIKIEKPKTDTIITKEKVVYEEKPSETIEFDCECGISVDSIYAYIDSLEARFGTHHSFEKAISLDKIVSFNERYFVFEKNYLFTPYPNPYKILYNGQPIDTLKTFDTVCIPYFKKSPYKIYVEREIAPAEFTLCVYKGKIGFINNASIVSKKEFKPAPIKGYKLITLSSFGFNKHILVSYDFKKYKYFDSHNIEWSDSFSNILYSTITRNTKIGEGIEEIEEIKIFNIKNWTDTIGFPGKIPTYGHNQNNIIYLSNYSNNEKWKNNENICYYNIETSSSKEILQIPDSLFSFYYGADFLYPTIIERIETNDKKYFKIQLFYHQDIVDNKTWHIYFDLNGIIEIKNEEFVNSNNF